jgi:hypothetical protein
MIPPIEFAHQVYPLKAENVEQAQQHLGTECGVGTHPRGRGIRVRGIGEAQHVRGQVVEPRRQPGDERLPVG